MLEEIVGPDGCSGGDDPPKMASNLEFELGTLSIFQVWFYTSSKEMHKILVEEYESVDVLKITKW